METILKLGAADTSNLRLAKLEVNNICTNLQKNRRKIVGVVLD